MNCPWDELDKPRSDVKALRVDARHPLDLYWGKDSKGQFLFIYEYHCESEDVVAAQIELVGIELLAQELDSKKRRLLLILKTKDEWELFLALCNDLIRATSLLPLAGQGLRTILARLSKWQVFFKKRRSHMLSEEEIRGLFSELYFLRYHLMTTCNATNSISFWKGPSGAPQDFAVNSSAVECKSKLGDSRSTVLISSIDQLHSPIQKLYLYVLTINSAIENHANSIGLLSLIEDIRLRLRSEDASIADTFEDQLIQAGYLPNDKYMDVHFVVIKEVLYAVLDGFPRLLSTSIPSGVVHVRYSIELQACDPYRISFDELELD